MDFKGLLLKRSPLIYLVYSYIQQGVEFTLYPQFTHISPTLTHIFCGIIWAYYGAHMFLIYYIHRFNCC